jgi:hypothetical protein
LKGVCWVPNSDEPSYEHCQDQRYTLKLAGIAAGDIYGTVVQVSTRIGYETIKRMDKYLSGDKTQLSQGNVRFNSLVVDKGRVEALQAWRQDKLQPQ